MPAEGVEHMAIDWLSAVLVGVSLALVIVAVGTGILAGRRKKAAQAAFFESRYGSSVDRMVAECGVDQARLRAIRDGDRTGAIRAVRELRKTDPVPLTAAADFVRRI